MKTLTFLLEKEFKQFFRDPFMPKMVVVFPVIIMLIIPLVANLDFKNINICIVDNDHSGFSRLMTDKISHSSYFILKETPQDYKKAMEAMDKRGIDIILEIPQNFERELVRNEKPGISIVANAVDASKGASGTAYLTQIVAETLSETMTANGVLTEKTPDLITVRNLYNPTGNYRHFMIPALTVMLIIIVCGALPALNIVKEKTGNDPLEMFEKAMENIMPNLECKTRRVGGANYQVPLEVSPARRETLGLRWLTQYSRARGEKTMSARLAAEIIDATNGVGGSVKKREDTHTMAEANKAFAHYRY